MTAVESSALPVQVLAIESPSEGSTVSEQLLAADIDLSIRTVPDVAAARLALSESHVDCVLCHHDPPRIDGVEALTTLREVDPTLPVLFATTAAGIDEAISAGPTDVVQLTDGRLHPGVATNRIASIVSESRARGKYEQIFEQASDGIVIHDPETGDVLEANRRFHELLSYDPEGDPPSIGDIVSGVEAYTEATARELIAEVGAEGPRTVEWLAETADGAHRWTETTLKPARIAGEDRVLSFVRDVTDRKANEQLLRDREQQLQAVFEHPASFVAVLDDSGRVVRANEPALSTVGASAAEVEGIPFSETPWWDEQTRERVRAAVERAVAGETPHLYAAIAAEDPRQFDLRFEPIRDEDGIDSIVVVGYDITERDRRERDLRENRRMLQRLHEITSSPDREFEEQVSDLLAFGSEQLDLSIGFLSRIDRDDGTFEVVTACGDHDLLTAGAQAPLSETYCRRTVAADTETPVAIPDAAAAGITDSPEYELFGLDSYIGDDIVVDGELYGTLCFADEMARERTFSDSERRLLDIMAQWLRQELSNREYRRELEATRDRIERTLERVDDAFFAVDRDWRVTYVNETGAAVLRDIMADPDDDPLLGRHLWELVPDAVDTTFYEEYHEAFETQEPVAFESHYEPTDTWFQVRAYPDDDGLSIYFTDVTERKERERTIDDLLNVTRTFHRAGDTDALVNAVLDAAKVFDHPYRSVRLHDPETGTLPPTRFSAAARAEIPDEPVYDDDERVIGEAFQSGEPVVVDDVAAETDYDYGPVGSMLVVPLGEHGTLAIGADEPGAFDHEDAVLVELLGLSATAALDRLERERETRQLRRIIDHVDEMGFLLDDDGHFSFVTAPLAEYLGLDRETLVGTPLADVLIEADATRSETLLERALTDGPVDAEVEVKTAVGRQRPVRLELSATRESDAGAEVAGVVTDISELTETRGTLAMERERFSELFENVPDPIAEVTFEGDDPVVEYINPAFRDVFGYDDTTLRGENLNDFIVPADEHGAAQALDERLRTGGHASREVRRTTPEGRRDFLLRAIPYERGDQAYGFVVYTDITEQKERERYFQVLNRVLRHNLRNDMTVVLGLAEYLADEVADPELEAQAARLRAKADTVASLTEKAKQIEDLVGRRDTAVETTDLVPLLTDTVADLRAAHPEAEITVDAPETARVKCSAEIERAVVELVENAVEHGSTPRVRITVDTDWPGEITIAVRDDGPGIPDEEWETVVGDADITQLNHGTGLGLWLTRWIVESFDGTLRREGGDDGAAVVIGLRESEE